MAAQPSVSQGAALIRVSDPSGLGSAIVRITSQPGCSVPKFISLPCHGQQRQAKEVKKITFISSAITSENFSMTESMRQEGDVVVGGQRFPRQSVGREQEEDSPLLLPGLQEGLHEELAPQGPPAHSHRHALKFFIDIS